MRHMPSVLSQAPAPAELERAGADDSNFALHQRNGELVAADPRTGGSRVRCCHC